MLPLFFLTNQRHINSNLSFVSADEKTQKINDEKERILV